MLKALKYILLYVSDVRTSIAFYRDTLGMELVFGSEDDAEVASVAIGGIQIILHGDAELLSTKRQREHRGSGVLLEFEVADVDLFHQQMLTLGLTIQREPQNMSFGLRQMYLSDPDGYLLAFSAPIMGGTMPDC